MGRYGATLLVSVSPPVPAHSKILRPTALRSLPLTSRSDRGGRGFVPRAGRAVAPGDRELGVTSKVPRGGGQNFQYIHEFRA
jgi:hypothetical protein